MAHERQKFRMRRPLIEHEGCLGPAALAEELALLSRRVFSAAPFLGFAVLSRSTIELARRTGTANFRSESDEAVFGKLYTRLPPRKTEKIQATATGLTLIVNRFVAVKLDSPKLLQDRMEAGQFLAKIAGTNAVGDRTEEDISMVLGELTTQFAEDQAPVARQLAETLTGKELWFGHIPRKLT